MSLCFILCLYVVVGDCVASEKQGNAPQGCQSHQSIDHTADCCGLTAEDPRYNVEAKQSHAAPVDAANDGQHQGDPIHDHEPYSSQMVSLLL